MHFFLLSLFCSLLTFLTSWLLLPIFLFCPLALYFAAKSHKYVMLRFPGGRLLVKFLAVTPMAVAVAAVPLSLIFINQNYQA